MPARASGPEEEEELSNEGRAGEAEAEAARPFSGPLALGGGWDVQRWTRPDHAGSKGARGRRHWRQGRRRRITSWIRTSRNLLQITRCVLT